MAIQRQAAPVPHTLLYNKQTGKQYLMGQTVPGLYAKQTISSAQAQEIIGGPAKPVYKNAMEAKLAFQKESAATAAANAAAMKAQMAKTGNTNPKLAMQQVTAANIAKQNALLASKGLSPAGRGGTYTLAATDPASLGLAAGWAPRIGHIKTFAETAITKKTNPLLASPVAGVTGRKRNPFQVEQTPSADLFGLNIPV